MRFSVSILASLTVLTLASTSFAQPTGAFPPTPPEPPPPGPPPEPPPTPSSQQPTPSPPPPPQPQPQPQPQPGQWQQQPGQWQQQPGQWQQQQPGQWQQQPNQWQQQPGWRGQPMGPTPEPAEEPRVFESSLGFKLLAGADLWTVPGNIDPGYDALGFAGSAGGFGYGAALYYEARIAQYFGIELDFGYDHSALHRDLSYKINGVPFNVTESVSQSGIRWGLLAKAIIPVTMGRVWFGLGPEFVSGSTVDSSVEVTSGNPTPQQRKDLENSISGVHKGSTALTMAFGVAVHIGKHVEIPFDLRAAKTLNQDGDWKDRVNTKNLFATPPRYEVTVQNSWDFRLGTGVAYRF